MLTNFSQFLKKRELILRISWMKRNLRLKKENKTREIKDNLKVIKII